MPLVHRQVSPKYLSQDKVCLSGPCDSEFLAVNHMTLVNVLRQLSSLLSLASEVFGGVSLLGHQVSSRIRDLSLRLEELEVKTELYDPRLIPVPEGSLDMSKDTWTLSTTGPPIQNQSGIERVIFIKATRPAFLLRLYDIAQSPRIQLSHPPLSPVHKSHTQLATSSVVNFRMLREWKLDDSMDGEIAKLKSPGGAGIHFRGEMVQVDVTGSPFDRMKANRRSLLVYTKRIRFKKKRRNTICGSLPPKECGIQTSLVSGVENSGRIETVDSGLWTSWTGSSSGPLQLPSSFSTASSNQFSQDDEDRTLTPQLENFTDGVISDSDSVDSVGYFTSFRSECGFPKTKKSEDRIQQTSPPLGDNEYEVFGKGSVSTTASSSGTVILRNPSNSPPSQEGTLEDRVKRKSLIECLPSLVVVTPSPPSESPTISPDEDAKSTTGTETELSIGMQNPNSALVSLPPPDVIPPGVHQLLLRHNPMSAPKVTEKEYCGIERMSDDKYNPSNEAFSSKIHRSGARVILDPNGQILFSSESLRRKQKQKITFDPGSIIRPVQYEIPTLVPARPKESVYERIRKLTNSSEEEKEKLYECIQRIREQNMGKKLAAEEPIEEELLETDLDSAIPPIMDELKTLPRIKDRLQRNESYRMAKDVLPSPAVANSTQPIRRREGSREEDPNFIHQVLSWTENGSGDGARKRLRTPPEDRPSFLRNPSRGPSPLTMEEIQMETHRFQKRFNVSTLTLQSPTSQIPKSASDPIQVKSQWRRSLFLRKPSSSTTLNEFKKLLQQAQPEKEKRERRSAVDLLKPQTNSNFHRESIL